MASKPLIDMTRKERRLVFDKLGLAENWMQLETARGGRDQYTIIAATMLSRQRDTPERSPGIARATFGPGGIQRHLPAPCSEEKADPDWRDGVRRSWRRQGQVDRRHHSHSAHQLPEPLTKHLSGNK